jgi:hypothetical protein
MTNSLLSEMWTFCHMIFSDTSVMTTRLLKEQSHEIFSCFFAFENIISDAFIHKSGSKCRNFVEKGPFIRLVQNVTANLDKKYSEKISQTLG